MEIFGHLERFLSETLYPYRVPLTAGAVVLLAALTAWVWRRGWAARLLAVARRRPAPSALLLLAVLAILVPLGNYLVAPLWTRSQVIEVSPLDVASMGLRPRPSVERPDPSRSLPPTPDASFQPRTVRRGEWKGADNFHFARGRALLVEVAPDRYILRLEEFSIRNGPDLFVMLSPAADGYGEGTVKLGRLKATDGSFNYEVPVGTDINAFKSVIVWCEQFAVLFGTATFTKA